MITLYWERRETSRQPTGGDEMRTVVGSLELDVLSSEDLSATSTLTEHPVDSGAPISDHVVPAGEVLSLEVKHSQSPAHLRTEGAARRESGEATVITVDPEVDRVGEALDALRTLVREGLEVDVEGLRRDVEGWVLTELATPRDVDTADLLTASLTLREVRKATIQEIDRPAPRVERGRRNTDRGRQAPQDTGSTATPARGDSSLLHDAMSSYFGWGEGSTP
jgi:poly-gamma-glutamate capsule biosynthesis protein CapA/YwtB (metallophosphatase superfamily)